LTTGSFPHDSFSSVYWIFTKLGHMIPLWKGKNLIYFGVIRSKVKVTVTINIMFDNGRFHMITLVLYIGSLTNLATWFPCGRGRTLFILESLRSKVKVTVTINIIFDNRIVLYRRAYFVKHTFLVHLYVYLYTLKPHDIEVR
jgi:hypothetical protein